MLNEADTEKAFLERALTRLRAYGVRAEVQHMTPKAAFDALLHVAHGETEATFTVEIKRTLRPATLGPVLHQLKPLGQLGLLVTEHVTPQLADRLREEHVQFVDLAGNAYINQPPLLLFIKGNRPEEQITAGTTPTGRAFQGAGLQIIFGLICNPQWAEVPYRDLALMVGLAHGTVGWVMADLANLGFIATLNNKRKLIQREKLLQQWAEFYAQTARPRLLLGRFEAQGLEQWWKDVDPTKYNAVLGGEIAGARMTQNLHPATATFYAGKIDPTMLLDLRLRPNEKGNVEVLKRFWMFEDKEGLAPEPLVYADLMATGEGRCMETGRLVYDQYFRH